PPGNCTEILCDGSFSQNLPKAGYGIIIKDRHGAVEAGYAGTLVWSSPIVAEAKPLLIGIRMAVLSGEETCVKTDCLDLVVALGKSPTDWLWQFSAWLYTMSEMLTDNPQIRISFIPRGLNQMADKIAKAAAFDTGQESWITPL
ncbi:hypothetical protein LINPERHAP2_LOCUS13407, partial [Linum perenne]